LIKITIEKNPDKKNRFSPEMKYTDFPTSEENVGSNISTKARSFFSA